MKPTQGLSDLHACHRAILLLLAVCTVSFSGCTAMYLTPFGENCFTGTTLPEAYAAAPIRNAQTLDLTQLASPTIEEDRICIGDVLDLSIAGALGSEVPFSVRVSENGMAELPEIGAVRVAGLNLSEAESAVKMASIERGYYRNPNVTVTIRSPKVNRITVIGAVKQPGVYQLRRDNSYLLNAFVAAGCLDENADTTVEIKKPIPGAAQYASARPQQMNNGIDDGQVRPASADMLLDQTEFGAADAMNDMPANQHMHSQEIDLVKAISEQKSGEYLPDGSVVYVKNRDPEPIQVLGLVNMPGQYDFPVDRDMRLLGVIAKAGGISNPLADKILVIRQRDNVDKPIIIKTSFREAKHSLSCNVQLEPGDVVSIERTTATTLYSLFNRIGVGVRAGSTPYFSL